MRQPLVEKVPFIRPPALTLSTLYYLDGRFVEVQDLFTNRPALLVPGTEDLDSAEEYEGTEDFNIALGRGASIKANLNSTLEREIASGVVEEVFETVAGNVEPDYDYSKLSPLQTQHRSILGKILRKGPRYVRWVESYGYDSLGDPDRLYSPRLAVGLASVSIRGRLPRGRSNYSKLRRALQPHPDYPRSRRTNLS